MALVNFLCFVWEFLFVLFVIRLSFTDEILGQSDGN